MRSLSQLKENILKLLWEIENPVSLKEISEKTGLKTRSTNMHLLGLRRAGHVSVSEDGYYTLTESGKEIIGFPKVDENFAKKVLSKTPPEKAFQFYRGIDQPMGISSDNLIEFCEKIKTIDIMPIEFHMARGDFELWAHSLGDIELAKRLRMIPKVGLTGEPLRERLYRTLKTRCDKLHSKATG